MSESEIKMELAVPSPETTRTVEMNAAQASGALMLFSNQDVMMERWTVGAGGSLEPVSSYVGVNFRPMDIPGNGLSLSHEGRKGLIPGWVRAEKFRVGLMVDDESGRASILMGYTDKETGRQEWRRITPIPEETEES
jgi:hypothetical protein